jgi:hypothetical protein
VSNKRLCAADEVSEDQIASAVATMYRRARPWNTAVIFLPPIV